VRFVVEGGCWMWRVGHWGVWNRSAERMPGLWCFVGLFFVVGPCVLIDLVFSLFLFAWVFF